MNENILICTVGGSCKPIVTAIREIAPVFVCFLCTDRDPGTGHPGSRNQVEAKDSVIKAKRDDPSPALPNIPTQAGLEPDAYEVRIVPTDDLDGVVLEAAKAIDELHGRYPDARILADYTGGTKTMTAGLVMAALETEFVALNLVTGARADLVQVHDGTEHSTLATAERVRLRRTMAPYLYAWGHFGYAEASQGLARLTSPRDSVLRGELQIARDLSAAFDAWDRFDHPFALRLLAVYRPRIGQQMGLLLKFLEILNGPDDDPRKEPARLLDLWRNAQRRAAQGRYDDAVARVYRLLEWTAQWLLRERAGIDTNDVPEGKAPEGLSIQSSREGKLQAGLFAAWKLVGHYLDGAPKRFAENEQDRLLDHLLARNSSILAHGYAPIDAKVWENFKDWLTEKFLPVLFESAAEEGLRMKPPQLPSSKVW